MNRVVYAGSRARAVAKLTALRSELQAGTRPPRTPPSLASFLDRWLAESVQPRVRVQTYAGYELNVRKHLIPALGSIRLDKLQPDDVQRLLQTKLSAGLSAKTVRYIRQVLSSALKQAVRWGMITRNVASLVDAPKAELFEANPFDPREAAAFLEGAKGHKYEPIFMLALLLGLRQSEILGLEWRYIDLNRRTLTVQHQLVRHEGRWMLVAPKTKASRRTLVIPDRLVDLLQQLKTGQQARQLASTWTPDYSNLVFTTRQGTPVYASSVIGAFHRLLGQVGLGRRRFHDLRHTCASLLLVAGVSPRVVMDVLGHSDIATTMNTYTHVDPKLRGEAVSKLSSLVDRNRDGMAGQVH